MTKLRIRPCDVRPGMYIVGFGGSWLAHPFWKRRFILEKPADLDKIHACDIPYVVIDTALGSGPVDVGEVEEVFDEERSPRSDGTAAKRGAYRPAKSGQLFEITTPEQRRAQKLLARSADQIRSMFEQLNAGWRVDMKPIETVFDEIEAQIEEDANTLIQVAGLKTKDNYTYMHSVAVCTLMICVGRKRGFEKHEIRELGLAGLLHDIGKITVADGILKKPGRLTDEEFESIKSHPVKGFELLKALPDVPEAALDVCLHHHEKMDGTGYPFGNAADKISFAARLGAVCDVFDALTSYRAYKAPWSGQKAITAMWSWEGHFDRELLFDLMQVLHSYAHGLVVKLASGDLALVLAEKSLSTKVPVVRFYCTRGGLQTDPVQCEIDRSDEHYAIVSFEDPEEWGVNDWEDTKAMLFASHDQHEGSEQERKQASA